jgi:hypothetical protein
MRAPRQLIDRGIGFEHGAWTSREPEREAGGDRAGIDLAAQESLWLELDRLRRELEDPGRREQEGTLRAAVEGIGIAFSGAFVAIALRSSALWAAALSSLPLWRRLDPLIVLGLSDDERRKLEQQQREARDEEGSRVGRVLDGSQTGGSEPG